MCYVDLDKRFTIQNKVYGSVRCVAFGSGGMVSKAFWAGPRSDFDHNIEFPEDLNLKCFFPNGSYSSRIITVPGTNFLLPNAWRIFVSSNVAPAPPNQSVDSMYGLIWTGNIVLAKYGRRDPTRLINIPHVELDFSNVIVGM